MSSPTGVEAPYGVRRGQTYFDGRTPVASEATDIEGREAQFSDVNYGVSGVRTRRTDKTVYARLMRNVSGAAIGPKLAVKCLLTGSGNEILGQFDGVAATIGTDVVAGITDEWLPSGGCPVNDMCWVVYEGPSKVTSAAAGDTTISIGGRLIIATGGKIVEQDPNPAAGTATTNQVRGQIGMAITAVAAINTDFLAYISVAK